MDGSINNIKELIEALGKIESGKVLEKDSELFIECQEVYKRLKVLDYFNPNDVQKTIIYLKNLPDELKVIAIGKLDADAKKLDPRALTKQDLDSLIKDYEASKDSAVQEVYAKEIYKRIGKGKEDIALFVKVQKEIAARNAENLKKIEQIDPKLKGEIESKLAEIAQGMEEIKAQRIEEMVLDEKEIKTKDLEKKVKEIVKDKKEARLITKEIERQRAEIKLTKKADELAIKTCEELKLNQVLVNEETRVALRENILKSWRDGDELKIPISLAEKDEYIITARVEMEADFFKRNNLESIVDYRAEELIKEVGYELRSNGVEDENLIGQYAQVLQKLNYSSVVSEVNDAEIVSHIEEQAQTDRPFLVQPEEAAREAKFILNNIASTPNELNTRIREYDRLRNLIGVDKLPKIKEVRVTEKMMAMFRNNPEVMAMINGAQRVIKIYDKVTTLPTTILAKLGFKDVGAKIITRIGGEAASVFVKDAALVIAQQGTVQGARSIFTALFSKGVVITGEGSAASALSSMATFFATLGPIGQVVAVVLVVVAVVVLVLKPIFDGIKKIKDSISNTIQIDLNGVKHYISDTMGLGGFAGSIGQFFFDVGTFLIGIQAYITTMKITTFLTRVVVFVFIGFFVYSLLQQNSLSSLVPPPAVGGGNCVLKTTATEEGLINCNQNAPTNDYPGINRARFVGVAAKWSAGKNYSEECYNDTVNKSLCAGINPAYSLWSWVHESGASNYSIAEVEDFGIHGQPSAPPKNFNAQLNYFLKLNPGAACPELGYWLSFATNYLTGTCDPDLLNVKAKKTGRDYLEEMQETWSWVTSEPMPGDIKIAKGGKNCGGTSSDPETPITSEYVDEKGQTWVCYGEEGNEEGEEPIFDPWDPSISVPEGCPSMLPTSGYFTQGPFAKSCSHQNMGVPAIDLGTGNGTPIVATHPGVAVLNHDGVYGYYIDVHGKCEGKEFYTRYAHMPEDGYRVGNNSTVKAGQQIGVVDDTGASSGPHLHYHISGLDTNKFGQYLGMSVEETKQLWGCCGSWNGKDCPQR